MHDAAAGTLCWVPHRYHLSAWWDSEEILCGREGLYRLGPELLGSLLPALIMLVQLSEDLGLQILKILLLTTRPVLYLVFCLVQLWLPERCALECLSIVEVIRILDFYQPWS
jgi:hypothetical protein